MAANTPGAATTAPPPATRAFLFDLDGVLVQTEELHHEAYAQTCAAHGQPLPWTFEEYCVAAHYGSERLEAEMRLAVPALFAELGWAALYDEKSRRYLESLSSAPLALQPGAGQVLSRLAALHAPRAIVTNSTRKQTALLRRRLPTLDSVPVWVTREEYAGSKPAPDGYVEALRRLGHDATSAIGFEDTPRGLEALARAGVQPVLVTRIDYPDLGGVAPALRVPDLAHLPRGWIS